MHNIVKDNCLRLSKIVAINSLRYSLKIVIVYETNFENFGKYPEKLEPLLGNLKSLIKNMASILQRNKCKRFNLNKWRVG